jgi:hypothetical protein
VFPRRNRQGFFAFWIQFSPWIFRLLAPATGIADNIEPYSIRSRDFFNGFSIDDDVEFPRISDLGMEGQPLVFGVKREGEIVWGPE